MGRLLPVPQAVQQAVNVLLFTQTLEERNQVQQLRVRHVIKPRLHRDCVLGVEDVGGRRVVYDDDFAELSAQSAEVFDVVSPVENTGFPEEPGTKNPPLVQQIRYRVGILG